MIVDARYAGESGVEHGLSTGKVGLATNQLREATYFKGELRRPLVFRDAMAALHHVVISDFRYQPKDRLAFKAWLAEQDRRFLLGLKTKSAAAKVELEQLESRLALLDAQREQRRKPFLAARQRYVEWAYAHQYELNYLFDPVITVHPDEVFFEAFSRDESSYARVGATHALFGDVKELRCGTTNIDFSVALARQLDRIRSYRTTSFDIAPGGLSVHTTGPGGGVHKEKKIELPESWVQGFHQVQSTMAMGLTSFEVAPIDLFNIIRVLMRKKTRESPRALRWELVPGKRIRAVLEPWELPIELATRHRGDRDVVVRTWGRDRLKTLARLLPVARRVTVYLAGLGMPSFYLVDLGELSFVLGLSGWTDNDWAGGAKFDLLTRRLDGSAPELLAVYAALKERRFATASALAEATAFGLEKTRSALSYLCQIGRAMIDLYGGVYRHRDLFTDGFTAAEAQRAVSAAVEEANPAQKAARSVFASDNVRIIARRPVPTGFKLSGSVRGTGGERVRPQLHVDVGGQIVEGTCTCRQHASYQLTKGPCEHLLALRLAHLDELAREDAAKH
ncbi:MAG: SWIM zinc finger family protein [Deltaproteobacteria bacterium]|nr:SWIM zinc finger family protein [Deltaproteobacteria bacterium]